MFQCSLHDNSPKKNIQIWSSKWCIKDEPSKLTSDLNSAVVSISTPPHNNNNSNTNNNSNSTNNNNTSATNGNNQPSNNNNNSSYYDTHNVFPTSVAVNNNNQDSILYDSITTISQAQNTLYAPSIGTAIGKSLRNCSYDFYERNKCM